MEKSDNCSCCNTVAKYTVSLSGDVKGFLCNYHELIFSKLTGNINELVIKQIPEIEIIVTI